MSDEKYLEGWRDGFNKALDEGQKYLKDTEAKKDGAYNERNRLVALLAALFPSSLEPHTGEDWGPDWRWVCYIDLPTGQVSWHIKTDELHLFEHVPRNAKRKWDNHTNDTKWQRVVDACNHHYLPF